MKYLIIAAQNPLGEWFASIYENDGRNAAFMDMLDLSTQNLSQITESNYLTVSNGRIAGDNIVDIEPAMRAIGFRKCDVCGAWVTPQDVRTRRSIYRDGVRKCALCLAKEQQELRLRKHSYHGTEYDVSVINGEGEHYDLDDVHGAGLEFEYYHGQGDDGYIKCTKAFYELSNDDALNRVFRVENDCTVDGEIITNVFTKKALFAFDWSIVTDVLKLNGNIDGNPHAGLHMHLSKIMLGDDAHTQCENFLKLQFFMKSYEEDFLKLCGRDPNEMYYCQFFSEREIENMRYAIKTMTNPWRYMPSSHGGCGCALNASGDTIEYRIGRNTNDPERIKHYVRFLYCIVENIKNVPFEKCYCLGKVTRLVPKETMDYWRKQGCFLHTNAAETRGVTL